MNAVKQKLLQELSTHVQALPLTMYNLNVIDPAKEFKTVKAKRNQRLQTYFQINDVYYKPISKIL